MVEYKVTNLNGHIWEKQLIKQIFIHLQFMAEPTSNKQPNWLLPVLIISVGAIIRLIDLFNLPYTYDEFSAIFRTRFPDFGQLIEKGVMVDGHPAGIQVFLYTWTRIFGETEWLVKLPFIMAGIVSIWYTYKIGKTWFNQTAAAFSAALIATLQYTVMYSQIARPYISGMMFCLIMVWHWNKMVFYPSEKPIKNSILFVLFASLACYNHYFSLLFAMVVGFSSLFFVNRTNLKFIMSAGIAIALLFIPHYSIFMHQLGFGGVEQWLNKPTPGFFADYLFFIFHYSWVLIITIGLVIAFCLYHRTPFFKGIFTKYVWLSFLWVIIPAIAGYIYSVKVAAVLQFSVLIFGFPFLLFLLFSSIPRLSQRYTLALTIAIMLCSTTTLVVGRQYYAIFYKSAYEYPVVKTMELKEKNGSDKYAILLHDDPRITQFYFNKHQCSFDYISTSNGFDQQILLQQLNATGKSSLIVSTLYSAPPELLQIVQEVFPYCIYVEHYYAGSFYVFSKIDSTGASNLQMTRSCVAENIITNLPQGTEWSTGFKACFWELGTRAYDYLDISAEVLMPDLHSEVLLVSTITYMDSTIDWRSSQVIAKDSTIFYKMFLSVKLADLSVEDPSMMFSTFIWNKSKTPLFIKNLCLQTRRGNPIIYSLYEPIPDSPIW